MSFDSKGKECYKLQNSGVFAMWTKSAMHCQIPMLSNLFDLVHSRFKQTECKWIWFYWNIYENGGTGTLGLISIDQFKLIWNLE